MILPGPKVTLQSSVATRFRGWTVIGHFSNTEQTMKPGGIWIVLGTLILVPVLGFAFVELLQRNHFKRLQDEMTTAVYSLEGLPLGRDAAGFVFLPEGASTAEARYQVGLAYNLEETDR